MQLTALIPTLESNDLPTTINFYTQHFDFTVINSMEDEQGICWVCLANQQGLEIMFKSPNTVMNYGTILLTGNLYLRADNAQPWWERLKDKVKIIYKLESFDYGMQEFAFTDNNRYVISIGSEIVSSE